jgi:hypothetical protein
MGEGLASQDMGHMLVTSDSITHKHTHSLSHSHTHSHTLPKYITIRGSLDRHEPFLDFIADGVLSP